MKFFITALMEKGWQDKIHLLDEFMQEKEPTSTGLSRVVVFDCGVGNEQVRKQLKKTKNIKFTQHLEIISISQNLDWHSYMKLFDSFFDDRFSVMFDQEIYILLDKNNVITAPLLLKAAEYLSEEVRTVFSQQNSFLELNLQKIVPKKDLKDLLAYFLNQQDYKAAIELISLDNFQINARDSKVITGIQLAISSMLYRLNWDFRKARQLWEETEGIWEQNPEIFEKTKLILERLDGEDRNSYLEKLQEIVRQIIVKLDTGDISGFLTRLYRLREMIVHYIWNYGQKDPEPLNHRLPAFEQIELLRSKMAKGQIEGFKTAYFFIRNGYLSDTLQIRNSSFIGHGRKGFSNKQWITAYMGTYLSSPEAINDFVQEIDFLFEDLGIKRDNNYTDINSHLIKLTKYSF